MPDPAMLQPLEAAVRENRSLRTIRFGYSQIEWTNVATAILKGAKKNTSLSMLELVTTEDFTPHPEVTVDKMKEANPNLQLVVKARSESASQDIT